MYKLTILKERESFERDLINFNTNPSDTNAIAEPVEISNDTNRLRQETTDLLSDLNAESAVESAVESTVESAAETRIVEKNVLSEDLEIRAINDSRLPLTTVNEENVPKIEDIQEVVDIAAEMVVNEAIDEAIAGTIQSSDEKDSEIEFIEIAADGDATEIYEPTQLENQALNEEAEQAVRFYNLYQYYRT